MKRIFANEVRSVILLFMKMFMMLIILLSCSRSNLSYEVTISQEELKICFLGDTGSGKDTQKKVALSLAQENCHSIHFLGDLIYPNGIESPDDEILQERFLNIYKDASVSLHQPKLHLTLGNHDHRGEIQSWKEIAKKQTSIFFPHYFYKLKFNDLCLVHLDTNFYKLPLKWGSAFEQSWWLAQLDLSSESGCHTKIALTHHPYLSRGKDHGPATGLVQLMLWSQVLGKFDYLISGHEHLYPMREFMMEHNY